MRGAAVALLLLAGACSVLHDPHAGPASAPWAAARAHFTRTGKLYDRFETHAIGTATYQAPEVRARRVAQVSAWKAMSAAERAALEAQEAADAERWDEFLVAFFTTETRDNDLDTKGSVWRVAVVVEGEPDVLPAEIRTVRVDSLLKSLYPHIQEFDLVYRVRFPRQAGPPLAGRRFTLRIAGSEGRMDFVFGG